MALFKHKKTDDDKPQGEDLNDLIEQHFFTANFREELRNHGRLYFEQIIKENGELFKRELQSTTVEIKAGLQAHLTEHLDTVIGQLNDQIKDYVAVQLSQQLTHHSKVMKESQDEVLESIEKSAKSLKAQYQELSGTLQQNIESQNKAMNETLAVNSTHLAGVRQAQDAALQTITSSAEALQQQYQQLTTTLQQSIVNQEKMMLDAFQTNMAQIIEHYLAGAINEQYDLRAQLPAIVHQMQSQQKEIMDDMNL